MWKFKSLKGKEKWLFLLTVGLILCILAFPADKLAKKASADKTVGNQGGQGGGPAGWQTEEEPLFNGWASAGAKAVPEAGETGGEDGGAFLASAKAGGRHEEELEQRVREILKNVDGVGAVDVMIVLKSSSEKVLHVDGSSSRTFTEEQDGNGGVRKIDSQEQGQSTVMGSCNGETGPIVEKELRPELSGIVISAQGGGNPTVQAEISAAMEALFGLPAHKIKVLKRVE